MYLTEEQIEALHSTWPDRFIIIRDEKGFCNFAGDVPSKADLVEAEKSDVYVAHTIRAEISRLEAEITSRRVRDALSGSEDAQQWLEEQEAKIKAERAKLGGIASPAAEPATPQSDAALSDINNTLVAVVRILLIAVYSDGKKTQAEMDELERQVTNLAALASSTPDTSNRSVSEIINDEILDVRAAMTGPGSGAIVDQSLKQIDNPDLKQGLCNAMYAILVADGVYHISENHILGQAMKTWQVDEIQNV